MAKPEVLNRLSSQSAEVIVKINPYVSERGEFPADRLIDILAETDPLIKGSLKDLKIPSKSLRKIKVSDLIVDAYNEAFLADSEKVEVHHLFHALLLHVSTEKYYLAKKNFAVDMDNAVNKEISGYIQDLNAIAKTVNYPFIG